jgi:hypothetical protein
MMIPSGQHEFKSVICGPVEQKAAAVVRTKALLFT